MTITIRSAIDWVCHPEDIRRPSLQILVTITQSLRRNQQYTSCFQSRICARSIESPNHHTFPALLRSSTRLCRESWLDASGCYGGTSSASNVSLRHVCVRLGFGLEATIAERQYYTAVPLHKMSSWTTCFCLYLYMTRRVCTITPVECGQRALPDVARCLWKLVQREGQPMQAKWQLNKSTNLTWR